MSISEFLSYAAVRRATVRQATDELDRVIEQIRADEAALEADLPREFWLDYDEPARDTLPPPSNPGGAFEPVPSVRRRWLRKERDDG